MSDPFTGEIRILGFNFAPRSWALCQGQTMAISQNTALFSLLGTNFGGNGTQTFQLPNLGDTIPIGQGEGPGLSNYVVGENAGVMNVTLNALELPSHSHAFKATASAGRVDVPTSNTGLGAVNRGVTGPYLAAHDNSIMAGQSIAFAGGNQPHNNAMPTMCMNFSICLIGNYPTRS